MKACQNCGKGVVIGKSGVHQYGGKWARRGPKTRRIWRANLHSARIKVGSNFKTVILCTKCLRAAKKQMKPKLPEVKGEEDKILIRQVSV